MLTETEAKYFLHKRKAGRTLSRAGQPKTAANIANLIALWRAKRIAALYFPSKTLAKAVRGEISWEDLSLRKKTPAS